MSSPSLPSKAADVSLAVLQTAAHHQLLKGVSRSFYLSLRLLPRPMRRAAGLAYLLARTSDTLADSASAPPGLRLDSLERFARSLECGEPPPCWPPAIIAGTPDPAETLLLATTSALLVELEHLPAAEARLIRDVCATIISGQRLDLERFGQADAAHPVALRDDAALDDYTWRVAGCVGAFWTRLGQLTLGETFSSEPPQRLEEAAIAYGKGLQLVNILRDLPADLASGRCYLPLAAPADRAALAAERQRWLRRATELVSHGFTYAAALRQRRLRVASVLPAMIARETLHLLATTPDAKHRRVKIPRRKVYLALVRAFIAPPTA